MPVRKIFSNQQTLRKKIDNLNGMLKTMQEQKSQLQAVLEIAKDWSDALRSVDRTKLGVPYIRAVKQLLGKIRVNGNRRPRRIGRKSVCRGRVENYFLWLLRRWNFLTTVKF